MTRSHDAPTSALRALIRGILSLGVLATVIAGLPALLCAVSGTPIPTRLPPAGEIWDTLRRPASDDRILLLAMRDLTWVAWLAFTLSTLAELHARLRGRTVRRLRGLRPLQHLTGRLITSTMLMFSTPSALIANLAPIVAASTATADPGSHHPDTPAIIRTPISDHNPYSVTASRTIQPRRPHPSWHTHIVHKGETLWSISRKEYGTGELYTKIFHANKDRPQPRGVPALTKPSWIYPKQHLRIPRLHGHSTPTKPRTPRSPSPHRPSQTPTPRRSTPHQAAPTPPRTNRPDHTTRPGPAPTEREHRHRPFAVELPSGAIIGLSLAAAISAAIATRRLHRRRRRVPAEIPGTAPAEPALPPALQRIRRAHLAGTEASADEEPKPHDGTEATAADQASAGESIDVALGDENELPLPLDQLCGLGLAGSGADAAARAIAVATLARRAKDQPELLIPATDAQRLFGQDTPDPHTVPGLNITPTIEDALGRLETEIIHRRRLLQNADAEDFTAFRIATPEEHLPTILLIAAPPPRNDEWTAAVLTLGRRLGIVATLLGPWPPGATCTIDEAGQITNVDADALHQLHGKHIAQMSIPEATETLNTLAAASDQARDDTLPPPRPIPQPPAETERPEEQSAAPVRLTILGTLRLEAGGTHITKGLRRKAYEMLTYLAVHRDGATAEAICEALWPQRPDSRRNLYTTITDTRRLLRHLTGAGQAHFIAHIGDHYRLDEDLIDVDLWNAQTFLAHAAHADNDQTRITALEQAAHTWKGELAAGHNWEWIEPARETYRRDEVDILARLAQLHHHDNPQRALDLLERALTRDRYNEEIYRRVMQTQHALGRLDAVRRTFHLLEARLAEIDTEPDDTTIRTLDDLLR